MTSTLANIGRETPDLARYPWANRLKFLGVNTSIACLNSGMDLRVESVESFLDANLSDLDIVELYLQEFMGRSKRDLGYALGYSGVMPPSDKMLISQKEKEVRDEKISEQQEILGNIHKVFLEADYDFNLVYLRAPVDGYPGRIRYDNDNLQTASFNTVSRYCLIKHGQNRTL